MAWFGDTFNDSLNSLKGQITKITKEVLAENADDESSEETQTLQERYKELEAYCASKDLEITSLREENLKSNQQFQAEIEYLRNENKRLKRNGDVSFKSFEITDHQIQQMCELENQLQQVNEEKEHLSQCLEELQNEHQNNLLEVVKMRDFYKTEMERVVHEYEILKSDLIGKESGDEVESLREEIKKLQLQVEAGQKEKEEAFLMIKKEIVEHETLKGKLEKLVSEIQALNEEKHKTDAENKKIKIENESLNKKIVNLESQLRDLRLNNQVENELECLRKKIDDLQLENLTFLEKVKNSEDLNKQITYFKDSEVETQKILKNFLNRLNCNVMEDEESSYKLIIKSIDYFEGYIKQKEEIEMLLNVMNEKLEGELTYLKNECQNLQVELMSSKEELKNACARIESQQQDCMIQSQTDDVKRLEQEVIRLADLLEIKAKELNSVEKSKTELEQEMGILKSMTAKRELELENEVSLWKNSIGAKEEQFSKLYEEKMKNEERLKILEEECLNLSELANRNGKELEEALLAKSHLEKFIGELKEVKEILESEVEDLKAQIIIKETISTELKAANDALIENSKKLQEEMTKWKEGCVDLEVDRQNLQENKNVLENEITTLKLEINKYAEDITRLQQELALMCQSLQNQNQAESQTEVLATQEESNQLQAQQTELQFPKDNLKPGEQLHVQQHRRTRSDAFFESPPRNDDSNLEVERLKISLQQEQSKYKSLHNEHQELKEKESSLRKELERLRIHLVEVEDHYTAEAVESERTISEFKSKLNAAEEQLKNSSTIYKSNNVRANQHLESLQSQIKLISVQRDDLQAKLSAAEDEVQKHAASLTSLQIVLEQFQQDKEREIEGIITKYEYQIQLSHRRFKEFETEIESLKRQLADAKNGLNAASRLGEQLDKKSQQIAQLEEELRRLKEDTKDMEGRLSVANQSNIGKIDKSLIKNLVVGYISSPQPDRKSQVLRIMASVLDFNQDERNKLGVDNVNSGWLSNLLHPKSDHAQNTQSLSEAFIRFLESESRPQLHMKLLPEQSQAEKPGSSSRTSPKPSPILMSEFVLPTFNSSHAAESTSILKDVLRDS